MYIDVNLLNIKYVRTHVRVRTSSRRCRDNGRRRTSPMLSQRRIRSAASASAAARARCGRRCHVAREPAKAATSHRSDYDHILLFMYTFLRKKYHHVT